MKHLAENDNSKNQIYFGPGFSSLSILPNRGIVPDSANGNFKAKTVFSWLKPDGGLSAAPFAQMILYPQYPEVRFSGFLRGSEVAPTELLAKRMPGRILFLGICDDGHIIGHVLPADDMAARELDQLGQLARIGVFEAVPLSSGRVVTNSRQLLLNELKRIHRSGWIDSKRLTPDGHVVDCKAPNCGGYTLEAELGITPNGYSEPDYLGWEVKQYAVRNFERLDSGSPITLMTPEPTGGYYVERSPNEFVRRFGYPDKMGRVDRLNFGGTHRVNQRQATTGLKLTLYGYDDHKRQITNVNGDIRLVSQSGAVAASWSFSHILSHWSRKHNQAAYVPSMSRDEPLRQYHYGHMVLLAEKTDPLRLLHAMHSGAVYYDPGIKLEHVSSKPTLKRRNQFRVHPRDLPTLYEISTGEELGK